MTERESETGLSRPARIAVWAVVAGLVLWFFFAWLALDRHVLDAAGESVGSGLFLLVIVSIVGIAVRRRS